MSVGQNPQLNQNPAFWLSLRLSSTLSCNIKIENIILSEESQTEKDKCDTSYKWNPKYDNMSLFTKDSQT